ncbi:MAG: cyclic nucleotide-binding domain-containing protein [Tannerellaceae bacterium]|nr:cyclic nucleotide-binding domain-containing protein [Tannerellaceae bacterium]
MASGQVEVSSKGPHGEDLRIALLSEGEYFGEANLLSDKPSSVTVHTITSGIFFTLDSSELENIIKEVPDFREQFQRAVDEHLRLKATVNAHGEKHIDLLSGHEEDIIIPETYIDYEEHPREYSLNTLQTVVRVHTRVSDLYNNPYNQLEEQIRLSIESIKERQEWELINNRKFGLLASVDPAYRISTRYGAPTPDDLDELISLVWKNPAFFLAHPRAIAAFERECTWRGVPPATVNMYGTEVITWRGIPIIPSDKVEIQGQYLTSRGVGTTSFILVRVGEKEQGVVGLHQSGIPGEIVPALSARLMGLDKFGAASYLLTKYFSLASLTDDAIAVLENVEVGYYHDYQHRNKIEK